MVPGVRASSPPDGDVAAAREDWDMTRLITIIAVAMLATPAAAQELTFALRPTSAKVSVTNDVVYGRADTTTLRMDVYRPEGPASTRRPALVFFNRAFGAERRDEFYAAWARAAASRGLVAIVPDLRGGTEGADFTILVRHLVDHGAAIGVDPGAISAYAGSGNVFAALPVLEDPAMTAVKSAVIYYGVAPVRDFRVDLRARDSSRRAECAGVAAESSWRVSCLRDVQRRRRDACGDGGDDRVR